MAEPVDVVVVGMGVAGEGVAGPLAEKGLEVVGIDKALVGGECPYWGCIPSKMVIRAADLLAEARRIPGVAGESSVTPDYGPVAQRIRDEATDNWNDQVAVDRFEDKGGRFVRGEAVAEGPMAVSVDGTVFEAQKALVLAGGTAPIVPPITGLDQVEYWTNHEIMEAKELPRSLVVLGGGAIGMELAQAWARFGVEVTVVEALDRLLPLEEPEASEAIEEVFEAEGITVRTGAKAVEVGKQGDDIAVLLEGGEAVAAQKLLVAVGRRTRLEEMQLDKLGLDAGARFVEIDGYMRTPAQGVWAVGDITGKGLFTHVATYQAPIAVASILGEDTHPADYKALPRVTFTDPEVGSVGLTEEQARQEGIDVRTGAQKVPHSARGWIHQTGNEGVIKLVVDEARGVLVGATSVGPNGGEVLGMLSLAVHAEIPVDSLGRMIYAYPTFHRGVEDAVNAIE